MDLPDKRILRSEELIRSTFFSMLEEMPAYKITVSELCRKAGINRGTFYLHYQDCYDLIEVMSNEIADKFEPYIEAICRDRDNLHSSVLSILPLLTEEQNVVLLTQESELARNIISRRFRKIIEANWKRLTPLSDTQAHLIYSYISGGVFAALHELSVTQHGSEDVYETVYMLIVNGLSSLVQQ